MKVFYVLMFLILFSTLPRAQIEPAYREISNDSVLDADINKTSFPDSINTLPPDSIKYEIDKDSALASDTTKTSFPDSINTLPPDSIKYNMYGDLLNDDPSYNKKSSLLMVGLRVTLANVTTLLIDRYLFNYNYSRVGFNSWRHNFETGWEWDSDRFAMNNFFHPFSGGMFFNGARANGYSYFGSVPFAVLGSLEWEYLGENTLPSYNDIINTPINGAFLGEIFYRLGSNILDDQSTGASRFFREMAVAIMTPTRFFSRLLQGKLTRLTPVEVYQKEPLNITLAAGYHRVNKGRAFNTGTKSLNMNLNLDYGNPFEKRSRKPFDYYKVRLDIDFGVGRKMIDNVIGYGILYGKNLQYGNMELLTGLFQHMSYFDNNSFELATLAFGTGMISKLPISKSTSLYTDLHLNIVPFGSLSERLVTDTSEFRDYNYGGGAEIKLESTFNVGWVGFTFAGYYWWFHSFVGNKGNSYIAVVKPRIAFRLFKSISLGFEQLIYFADRYPNDFPSVHDVKTEQKIFFQIFLEEFKFTK